jgi:hypothetical protein
LKWRFGVSGIKSHPAINNLEVKITQIERDQAKKKSMNLRQIRWRRVHVATRVQVVGGFKGTRGRPKFTRQCEVQALFMHWPEGICQMIVDETGKTKFGGGN